MPGCILKLLNKLKHVAPSAPQHSLNPSPHITCRAKVQLAKGEDASPLLDSIIGTMLCIARILEMSLLVTCNDIGI